MRILLNSAGHGRTNAAPNRRGGFMTDNMDFSVKAGLVLIHTG
jgi:hypothetical protein